jgi:hypothetical protein
LGRADHDAAKAIFDMLRKTGAGTQLTYSIMSWRDYFIHMKVVCERCLDDSERAAGGGMFRNVCARSSTICSTSKRGTRSMTS